MIDIQSQTYEGSRLALLPLFQLADESDAHIRSYINIGHVRVARRGVSIVGMVQIFCEPDAAEIVSLAVAPEHERQGIGTALIQDAIDHCRGNSVRRLIVCTGSWETENIEFYVRRGFRVFNVVRDFFTPEKGYARELRDQTQLEMYL